MLSSESLARVRLAVEHYKNAREGRDRAIADALAAGCTQADVAAASGLSASNVRKINTAMKARQ